MKIVAVAAPFAAVAVGLFQRGETGALVAGCIGRRRPALRMVPLLSRRGHALGSGTRARISAPGQRL